MNLPRISLHELAADLRARTAKVQERLEQATDAAPTSARAVHGGVTSIDRAARQALRDTLSRERRRQARAAIARLLGLAEDTDVDVTIDVATERATFSIRDLATGDVLREIPEAEAHELLALLRAFTGSLVDRSL